MDNFIISGDLSLYHNHAHLIIIGHMKFIQDCLWGNSGFGFDYSDNLLKGIFYSVGGAFVFDNFNFI